ncbi:MAG: ankyrin repeat domain-containing protein [Candidatus Amoebophilus sp.]
MRVASKSATFILAVSLCLQSCKHSYNPSYTLQSTNNNAVVCKKLADKTLFSKQEHRVSFYQEKGQLQALVEEVLPQGFSRNYTAPVVVDPSLNLAAAPIHNPDWQKIYVHIINDQVYIVRAGGLLGGGKGKKNQRKVEESNSAYALHRAINRWDKEATQQLLQAGVDATIKNKDGNTPLHLAIQQINILLKKHLVELGIHIIDLDKLEHTSLQYLCIEAAKKEYIQVVKDIILQLHTSSNLDLNIANNEGDTLLHLAASEEQPELVELLLNLGAHIDVKSKLSAYYPLHCAVENGHVEIVKLLIKNGADINVRSQYNSSPLHYAAGNGHVEIVKLLIENGAVINARDLDNETPLHMAALYGHIKVAKLLVDKGANVNIKSIGGLTPAQIAIREQHISLAKLLAK